VNATIDLGPAAARYVAEVGLALADLPDEERDELLEDVGLHVGEVEREGADDLVARLGPPDAFAAELRAAAGLPPRPAPAPVPLRAVLTRHLERIGNRLRWVGDLRDLAPAWWVARAYVGVTVVAAVVGDGWSSTRPWLPSIGSDAFSVALLLAAVVASVALGRYTRSAPLGGFARAVLLAANGAGMIAVFAVAGHFDDALHREQKQSAALAAYQPSSRTFAPGSLLVSGRQVLNIYPVDRSGKPLTDVRLYTDYGEPIDLRLGEDPTRRLPVDDLGHPVYNAFPARYVDPATRRVTNPLAGFPHVGVITAPALE
jgi:hypothetical protein